MEANRCIPSEVVGSHEGFVVDAFGLGFGVWVVLAIGIVLGTEVMVWWNGYPKPKQWIVLYTYPELDKKVWKIQAEQDLFSVFSFT